MNFKISRLNNGWLISGWTQFHGDFQFSYGSFAKAMRKIRDMQKTAIKYLR